MKVTVLSHTDYAGSGHKLVEALSRFGYNVDILKYFITQIPEKISSKVNDNLLIPIIRSFDINKPGNDSRNLKGGVIGGSIISHLGFYSFKEEGLL